MFQALSGDYVVMDYENCAKILSDKSCEVGNRSEWMNRFASYASKKELDFSILKRIVSGMLLNMNGDAHMKARRAVMENWPSKERLDSLVEECVEKVMPVNEGPHDLVLQVTKKLPVMVISRLMNLPEEGSMLHYQESINLVQILDPYLRYNEIEKISESGIRLHQFILSHIERIPLVDHQNISNEEKVFLALFLFIAGFETTSALLSNCLYYLLKNPVLISELNEDEKLNKYINEILRLYSPVHILGRKNTKTIKMNGVTIPENSTLTLCIGSANRDENVFEHADQLDYKRKRIEHLSFGYGLHHCLGDYLARLEAKILIKKFLPLLDRIELIDEPVRTGKLAIRNFSKMEVELS